MKFEDVFETLASSSSDHATQFEAGFAALDDSAEPCVGKFSPADEQVQRSTSLWNGQWNSLDQDTRKRYMTFQGLRPTRRSKNPKLK